ncbi:uroporphyrinogen-III C-methyltransferase [Synechococcus sp. PCC 7336]|uniref:uroporphyrinogen-III C-methyltransferase n=1 Tax=Synechococcus sp. PCC 7336 TaxID=195250 RepID=UPI000345C800|nr:uroporphyrinogen-III C-methyltransferase [Synechococcus sp. PCC 7336]
MAGKVYLVGAGPGDPGLMTVRGKTLLEHCHVVVYDALVSQPILDVVPPQAERIYAGKRKDQHSLPQAEIAQLLIDKARSHAVVVRLKGGDPFVFGRGGEEMLALRQAGIDVEVVPGITAGIAAPAYAGIPVTHRDYSSSVTFVTGHEAVNKYRPQVNWRALATGTETLVVYMGIHNLKTIASESIAGGKPADTPVAVIRWGTTPQQSAIQTNLAEIIDRYEDLDLAPPAIVVIGPAVNLGPLLQPELFRDP